jgi:hypothetical protein
VDDARVQEHISQVLKPSQLKDSVQAAPVCTRRMQPTLDKCIKPNKCIEPDKRIRQDKRSKPDNDNKSPQELDQANGFTAMELLWKEAQDKDQMYKALLGVATRAERTLPEAYQHLRISPSDLSA